MIKIPREILPASILLGTFFVCFFGMANARLSERPRKVRGSAPVLTPEDSIIHTQITIPYSVLTDILNREVPAHYDVAGREPFTLEVTRKVETEVKEWVGGDVGRFLGSVARLVTRIVTLDQIDRISGDINYAATIKRNDFSIAPHGNGMRISLPLSFEGQAGLNGDLARFLALDRKNFHGAMQAWADCTFGLHQDWSPRIIAVPDFQWDTAKVEIAERVWISIRSVSEAPLKAEMNKLPDRLLATLKAKTVRQSLQPWWKSYIIPLRIEDSHYGYVHVAPREVGLSAIEYTPEGIRLSLMLLATSVVSSKGSQILAPPEELPTLAILPPGINSFRVKVPLSIDYDELTQICSTKLSKEVFQTTSSAGPLEVTLKGTEIYRTEENALAIGINAKIIFPESPRLSTEGVVYLVAEPYLDQQKQEFNVRNVSFRRNLDNKIWSIVSVLFEDQIKAAIQDSLSLNLLPFLDKIEATITDKVSSPELQRVGKTDMQLESIKFESLSFSDRAVDLTANVQGKVSVILKSFDLARNH